MGRLTPPALLGPHHSVEGFNSGEPTLDNWLKRRAFKNQSAGAARTYVIVEDDRVCGYYALAVGSMRHEEAIGTVRRNMPDPVPVMILARLAVDISMQGKGIGKGLVRDALVRTEQAADIAGIRAILVHALNEKVRQFYESIGFQSSPVDPMTQMILIKDLRRILP